MLIDSNRNGRVFLFKFRERQVDLILDEIFLSLFPFVFPVQKKEEKG